MPLMALSLPSNVQAIYDEFDKIANLDFIPKDEIFAYFFGEQAESDSGASMKDQVLAKAGFSKDNLLKSIFLVVAALFVFGVLIALVIVVYIKCFHHMPYSF